MRPGVHGSTIDGKRVSVLPPPGSIVDDLHTVVAAMPNVDASARQLGGLRTAWPGWSWHAQDGSRLAMPSSPRSGEGTAGPGAR